VKEERLAKVAKMSEEQLVSGPLNHQARLTEQGSFAQNLRQTPWPRSHSSGDPRIRLTE
jgi:hypothetical protein